jgi:thymidylate synthase
MARNALTFESAWHRLLRDVCSHGWAAAPRGMPVRELAAQEIRVLSPYPFTDFKGRNLNPKIAVIEAIGLVGGMATDELTARHVRSLYKFTDEGRFHGAYGIRVRNQMRFVLDTLRDDPDSRQAVMTIFDGDRDLYRNTRDTPCTLSLQFLIRDDCLNVIVTMRSNDLWLGTPYDFFQFGVMQATMAQLLGIPIGWYVHQVGSLHVYEKNVQAATDLERQHPLEPPHAIPDLDTALWSESSLAYITNFCQRPRDPGTWFEEFIVETLS